MTFGTRAHARRVTQRAKGSQPARRPIGRQLKLKMNPDLVVSGVPGNLVYFKYKLYLAKLFIAGAVVTGAPERLSPHMMMLVEQMAQNDCVPAVLSDKSETAVN